MRTTFTTAIALAAALAAWSCYQDDTTGPGGREPFGAPFTTVEITDAPFPYDSVARVDLYIVSIQASPSPDTSDLNPDWVTIAEPHQAYNLIDLQGGVTDTLGGKIIPAGQYRAVRMVLDTDSSSITAKNGQPMPVAWQSSAGRPTLFAYVEDPIGVSDTGAQIVIDFDVGRSFLCDAPCSSFVFSPVFRAVTKSATGSISGVVRGDTLVQFPEAIKEVTVTVFRGNVALFDAYWTVVATGKTDAQGNFRISYLLPGQYIVRVDAPRGSPFTPGVIGSLNVEAGQDTRVSISLPRLSAGTIQVSPLPDSLIRGDSIVLTAAVVGPSGPIPNPRVTWTSLDSGIAPVYQLYSGPQALVYGRSLGTARIMVSGDGSSATLFIRVVPGVPPVVSSVTISPPAATIARNDTLGLFAFARDPLGAPIANRTYSWITSDTLVARLIWVAGVGNNYAIIRGINAGTATVSASADGKTGTATITVTP